jgi:hypothetical protein
MNRPTIAHYARAMLNRISKLIVATGAAASISAGAIAPRPASANTTTTILTAAAAIGAIVLYNNVQRKQAAANQIVGYTRNGGTVYADGRVVMPDGQTYYPSSNTNGQYGYNHPVDNGQYNNGQYNNGQYGYNNGQYANNGQYGYNNGQYANSGRYANNGQYANRRNANDDASRNRARDRDHR